MLVTKLYIKLKLTFFLGQMDKLIDVMLVNVAK
jgi:hypothetical protein